MKNEVQYLDELNAIWLGKGRTLEGSRRLSEGDYVALDFGSFVQSEYATHKVLGTFGDMFSTKFQVMLWNVITGEVTLIEL